MSFECDKPSFSVVRAVYNDELYELKVDEIEQFKRKSN